MQTTALSLVESCALLINMKRPHLTCHLVQYAILRIIIQSSLLRYVFSAM